MPMEGDTWRQASERVEPDDSNIDDVDSCNDYMDAPMAAVVAVAEGSSADDAGSIGDAYPQRCNTQDRFCFGLALALQGTGAACAHRHWMHLLVSLIDGDDRVPF